MRFIGSRASCRKDPQNDRSGITVRRSLLTQPTSEKFIVSLVRGADSDAEGDSKKRVKRSSFALCITHTGLYAEILARMFEQARLNRHA